MILLIVLSTDCIFYLQLLFCCFFFFKQKTAYEMRISDWSSDVCSSDLHPDFPKGFWATGLHQRDGRCALHRQHETGMRFPHKHLPLSESQRDRKSVV